MGGLSGVRQKKKYPAVRSVHEEKRYPIKRLCDRIGLNRSSYYKWLRRKESASEVENKQIAEWIKELYEEQNGILGYRQMTIAVNRNKSKQYNVKRIRRLMKHLHLKSVCRRKRTSYIPSTPEVTAENLLNREFHADAPNLKWLTDVTEFKYYDGPAVKKLYLSAFLDLYDRRIVAYKIGTHNNNELVFSNFDEAVALNPDAHPLFHSDRGFQYTNKKFKAKLEAAGMTQSMSRVGRCIDNGPMEGFWGILKSEMYYLKKFSSEEELRQAIERYIHFYNARRYQKRLNCMTPLEFHNSFTV